MKNKISGKKWGAIGGVVVIIVALMIGIGIYNMPENRLSRQLDLGQKYLSEQNYEQAAIEFDKAIEIEPKNADAYLGMADAYFGMGDYQKAIEVLEEGYSNVPEEYAVKEYLVEGYLTLAESEAEEGNYRESLLIFDRLLDLDEENEEVAASLNNCQNSYVNELVEKGNHDVIRDLADKYENQEEIITDAYINKSKEMSLSGKYEDSLDLLDKLLELDKESEKAQKAWNECFQGYLDILMKEKQHDAIRKLIQKYDEKKEDIVDIYIVNAEIINEEGKWQESLEFLKEALDLDGNNEKIYQSMEKCLGRYLNALMEEKQYDEIRILAEGYGDIVGAAYFEEILKEVEEQEEEEKREAEAEMAREAALKREAILNNAPLTPVETSEYTKQILASITNADMTTYQKVKACYDWLINTYEFGDYDPYFGIMVCDGYTYAFVSLTRAIGLNSYGRGGLTHKADGGYTPHAWAVIVIDGVEYVFDPQVEDNIAKGGYVGYYRFFKTYAEVPDKYRSY